MAEFQKQILGDALANLVAAYRSDSDSFTKVGLWEKVYAAIRAFETAVRAEAIAECELKAEKGKHEDVD